MLDEKKLSDKQCSWLRTWLKTKPEELEPILKAREEYAKTHTKNVWRYTLKYLFAAMLTLIFHIHVPRRKIERLHGELVAACRKDPGIHLYGFTVDELLQGLDEMWPRIAKQTRNIGHYLFVKDHGMYACLILAYIEKWSPGTGAMEFHLGYALSALGQYRKVSPKDEYAYRMVMQESTAKGFTWRDYVFQKDLVEYLLECKYKPNLCVMAGGTMTELRSFSWRPEYFGQLFNRVEVYDRDKGVPDLLKEIYPKPMSEYGINYHIDDVRKAFRDKTLRGQMDIVYAKGFMSYHATDEGTRQYLSEMMRLLKPGGIIIAEWQVREIEMIRCGAALGWGGTTLNPEKNVKKAVERISLHAEALGLKVKNYVVEPGTKHPTFVKFCLRKPN